MTADDPVYLDYNANFRFPRVSGNAVLRGAPEVAASTGSACHGSQESASAVILAMGLPRQEALGSVRLGRGTASDDISKATDSLSRSWRRLLDI